MRYNKLDGIIEGILSLKPILFRNLVHPVLTGMMMSSGTHYVLSTLDKCGTLSMSELSRKISIPKPNLTSLIDRMIEQGLVKRLNDEHDRRMVKVELTDDGSKKIEELREGIRQNIRSKLIILDDTDLEILSDSLNKVNEILSRVDAKS